ncbi:hypothetical protein [Geobacter sp. AOG2]|uniref:hypothetical protein n=1 Tax=Geobacter sp. AOG2 TaxID=1566347 RepID=UPI001CC78261|nr:hypothetical protein [Geobacter sp. AOG2]
MTIAVFAATIFRKPQLLYHPRFYAEEGSIFFQFAFNNSFLHYLLTPHFGYYALYNVISTSLAALFPLEISPLITTYEALILQLSVSLYVVWSDISLFNTHFKRYLIAISFPLLCPGQIWLTTVGIQYWLCILTVIILLDKYPTENDRISKTELSLLALAGLTGILSCIMTPLFIIKAVETKSKKYMTYAYCLTSCSILQISVFVYTLLHNANELTERFISVDETYVKIIKQTTLLTSKLLASDNTLNYDFVDKIDKMTMHLMITLWNMPVLEKYVAVYFLTGFVMLLIILPLLVIHRNNTDMLFIIFSAITVYTISVKLSINGVGGPRYIFAPSAMIMIFLVSAYGNKGANSIFNCLILMLISLIMVNNCINYIPSMDKYYNDEWPRWEEEVGIWRRDGNHQLKIWPPPWQMSLKRESL